MGHIFKKFSGRTALSERAALPIAVLGASGQIGRALCRFPGSISLRRPQYDLDRMDELLASLSRLGPLHALINAAAYTQVDRAESDRAEAERINTDAPERLARWAAEHGVPFIHYSTDYVFPGTGTRAWSESDATDPLNIYGKTKLAGERAIQKIAVEIPSFHYLIFRTSWVYDAEGANFLNTMLRLGRERDSLNIVSDQIGAPSFAADLATATLRALGIASQETKFPSGVYHLTNSGETSWHDFAEAIFREARMKGVELRVREVRAVPSAEYPTPAQRPLNSRLSNEQFQKTFGFALRPWHEALHECMKEKSQS